MQILLQKTKQKTTTLHITIASHEPASLTLTVLEMKI